MNKGDWIVDRRTCRNYRLIWIILLILLGVARSSWAAGEVVIKMATIAPSGSEWHQVLQEMGADVAEGITRPDTVPPLPRRGGR